MRAGTGGPPLVVQQRLAALRQGQKCQRGAQALVAGMAWQGLALVTKPVQINQNACPFAV